MQDKVGIIGAGNIGSNLALRIAESNLADVFLLDKFNELAFAKAMDISDALVLSGAKRKVYAAANYNELKGLRIIVITAGLTRKPGESREDLLKSNAEVVKDIAKNLKKFCKDSIVIVVTNPLDAMSYLIYKVGGFKPSKVIGMAGVLDCARLCKYILNAKIPAKKIIPFVLGSHGDSMVPLKRHTLIGGRPLNNVFSVCDLKRIIALTRAQGAEIVKGYKTTSAYFGPAASIYYMVYFILKNKKGIICASCFLNGEYGLRDLFIGVPAVIGKNGVEKIIELDLNKEEKIALYKSAKIIKDNIEKLKI